MMKRDGSRKFGVGKSGDFPGLNVLFEEKQGKFFIGSKYEDS